MKRICAAICLVAMVSCKKDIHTEPKAKPLPNEQDNPDGSQPNPNIKITSLDLSSINFTPSTQPISFNSVAVGRVDSTGLPVKLPLSSSGWTHPSTLRLFKPWNGYRYWLAITPYPKTDSQYENPHIFCSNDGKSWSEPKNITNPIEPVPEGGYNSDVNLLLEGDYLYCYYRENNAKARTLWVKKSRDGVHWQAKEYVCEVPTKGIDVISPSFVKENDKYYCYAVCNGEDVPGTYFDKLSIRRMISDDPIKGFKPERGNDYHLITINDRPWGHRQDPWHLEVKKLNNIWLMLVSTTNHNAFGSGGRLFLGYSTDGLNFDFNSEPICDLYGSSYKSSFHAEIDVKNNSIQVQLWRAMMTNGWAVFYDNFTIKTNFDLSV